MDSQLTNKAIGAICVAGLVFLFGNWGIETLTHRGELQAEGDDGHGGGEVVQAYAVEIETAGGEVEGGADLGAAVFLASADAASGEKIFNKCKACHSVEPGKNGTGPSLNGVFGAAAGHVGDFQYSDAMLNSGLVWDGETLFTFLTDVKGTVPGTKMSFPGLPKEQDRADVIAYLAGAAFDPSVYAASATAATGDGAAAASEEPAETTETATLVGDAATGAKVFNKCKACHSVEPGKNGTGPSLAGVVGKPAAQAEGFKYSQAMIDYGQNWTEENLTTFLKDVKGTVPGTKMSFPGLSKDQDVADVIAFLSEN